MKIAFIYPGQGAQYETMGKNLYEENHLFKEKIDYLNQFTVFDLPEILTKPNKSIHETQYSQPSILAMSLAIKEVLKQKGIVSDGSCGLSLGEYAAYVDTGVINEEEAMHVITNRAHFMEEAALKTRGKMAACLAKEEMVEKAISHYDSLYIANYNTEKQIVISGDNEAIDLFSEEAKNHGVRKVIILNTSGAFHSPLMNEAKMKFREYLHNIELKQPRKSLYLNTTGTHYISDLKNHAINQMTQPVHFYAMINAMIKDGFDTFIECGPSQTLSNLVKKIKKDVRVYNVSSVDTLAETLKQMERVRS